MDMKHMKMFQINLVNIKNTIRKYFYIIHKIQGGIFMLKILAKIAEKYAKSTNTACGAWFIMHQPKMPANLVKKD